MRLRREAAIQVKTPEQFAVHARGRAGRRPHPGGARRRRSGRGSPPPTWTRIAEREIRAAGRAVLPRLPRLPREICASVNETIVHGIPDPARKLRDGDIISIDCGAVLDGWHGDAALTIAVGEITAEDQALLDACEAALWPGLAQAPSRQPAG